MSNCIVPGCPRAGKAFADHIPIQHHRQPSSTAGRSGQSSAERRQLELLKVDLSAPQPTRGGLLGPAWRGELCPIPVLDA